MRLPDPNLLTLVPYNAVRRFVLLCLLQLNLRSAVFLFAYGNDNHQQTWKIRSVVRISRGLVWRLIFTIQWSLAFALHDCIVSSQITVDLENFLCDGSF